MVESALDKYIAEHTSYPGDVLQGIDRNTHLKTLAPQMMSGHVQGRLLSMLSYMIRPDRILEVGTFTAYATLCLSEGLAKGGVIDTIEVNKELKVLITEALTKANKLENIYVHYGDALEIIPTLDYTYDMVFIDAAKSDYLNYYELVVPKLRRGGFLLADNVLWSGKVLDEDKDEDTLFIHEFNERIQADPRVENVIMPVRDGIMLCRKK